MAELYTRDIEAIIRTWYERHIKTESDKPFAELSETVLCRFRDQAKDTNHALNLGTYDLLTPSEQRLADVIVEYRAWQARLEKLKAALAALAEADALAQAQAEKEAKAKAEAERLAAENSENQTTGKEGNTGIETESSPMSPVLPVVQPIEETPASLRKSKQ